MGRPGHVVEARDDTRDRLGDAKRRHEPLVDASVPEPQDVERFAIRIRPDFAGCSLELVQVLDLGQQGIDETDGVGGRAFRQLLLGQAKKAQILAVVRDDSSLEVHGDDAAARRVEGGVDEREGLV